MADTQRNYYRSLYNVARAVNASLDLNTTLSSIVKSSAEALDGKGSLLRLLDKQGEKLFVAAAYGLSEGYLQKGPVEIGRSQVDKEALAGKSVTITDVTNDPRFQYPEEAKREGIVSMVAAPLKVHGKPIGVLRVYSDKQREFSPEDVDFISAIADLSAVAIEQARLHQETKTDYENLVAFENRTFEL